MEEIGDISSEPLVFIKKGFLQACINFGSLDMSRIEAILGPMCEAYEVETFEEKGIRALVKAIHLEISQYNQQLTFVKHPLLDEEFLVFGYSVALDVLKWQSHYSDQDRLYFRILLDAVAATESFGITWIAATNLTCSMPGNPFAKHHAQSLLRNWIKQGYYIEKDFKIYWGPRMIVEFANYLKTAYADIIKDCNLCSQILLWGTSCRQCATKFHSDCIRKFIAKSPKCPSCRKEWMKNEVK